MSGFFLVHRQLIESDLWLSERFTRGQAWIDLISLASFKDGFIRKRGIKIKVKRGCVGHAQDTLKDRWQWSRGKVKRFLNELENDGNIVQQTTNRTTLIFIVKYEEYQSNDKANGTAYGHQTDTKRTPNGTVLNKETKINKKERGFIPPSLDEVIEYCSGKNSSVNPLAFHAFYEGKGWMTGKNKIKKWKSCVTTWEERDKKESAPKERRLVV